MFIRRMFAHQSWRRWRRPIAWIGSGLVVLASCTLARIYWAPELATAAPRAAAAAPAASAPGGKDASAARSAQKQKLNIVAIVNGEKIDRSLLAREALHHYGDEVLEALLNKYLIVDQCELRHVTVSSEEVSHEIQRMAERFGLSTDAWLKMLNEERNVTPIQYARDIIWPSIALRKLADARLQVSEQEIQEAYETQFGPQVQVRLMAFSSLEKAREIQATAIKNPDEFGNLAKQYSEDVNSASVKGLAPPIRMHLGDPKLQLAFGLQPGQISDIIAIDNQYLLLKCEQHLAGRNVPMEQVHKLLSEGCRDKKLRLAANDVLVELQKQCHIENFFADPAKREQNPGIAAIINNRKITVLELAEECIERNGKQVLEGTINRRLLEQACLKHNITITTQEMDDEIARAAVSMGKTRPDGSADMEAWIKDVVDKQKTTLEIYRNDVVWPTVALKKLVKERVEVTRDDLQKGYEANFGQRVRCLAIVFNQPRKAQEVWEMARNHQTAEFFASLAEEYSVEPTSRALRGDIPPIQKYGGQPVLEKEAFAMHEGELSGVIQVSDKYVILFCQGFTGASSISFEDVRDQIYEDVYEKKLRLVMAKEFSSLQDSAQTDNFLAGTSHSPYKGQAATDWTPGKSISHPATARTPDDMPSSLRR